MQRKASSEAGDVSPPTVKKEVKAEKKVHTGTKKVKTKKEPPVSTGYWMMKSEPGDYSLEDLERDRTEGWVSFSISILKSYFFFRNSQ